MAPGGCQLWRWDITEIKDTMKWQSFHRYVIINVFSRYVVGWRVADRASDTLAGRLLAETIVKEYLSVEGLTVHADRGLVDAVQAGGSGTRVWRCSRPTRATTTSQPRRGYGKDEGRNR
jgi:transposase InsO family protein